MINKSLNITIKYSILFSIYALKTSYPILIKSRYKRPEFSKIIKAFFFLIFYSYSTIFSIQFIILSSKQVALLYNGNSQSSICYFFVKPFLFFVRNISSNLILYLFSSTSSKLDDFKWT